MASPDYSTIDDPYNQFMDRDRENGGMSSEDKQEQVGTGSESGGYGGMNATESGGSSATGGDPSDLPAGAVGGGQFNDIWVGTWLKSTGYKPGKRGFYLDGRTGFAEFADVNVIGTITSSSIHIPDQDTTPDSFHVDEDGNVWIGATETSFNADNSNAKAYILNTGVAKFQDITLESSVTIRDIQENSEVAMQNWTTDITFSATDSDTVSWTSGDIKLMAGDTFNINSSNTGDMGAKTYIYFDKGTSQTDLQTSTAVTDAVGQNKILIAVAEPSSNEANFQVFGGEGGLLVDENSIEQRTLTANRIAANTITGNEISALNILGKNIQADTGTIGGWTLSSNSFTSNNVELNANNETITLGSASDPTTGTGIFMGLDGSDYEFRAGDPSGDNIHWDGSSLGIDGFVSGTLTLGSGPSISIDGSNTRIRSSNYVPGTNGAGFTVEPDLIEANNISARGTIKTAVFEKQAISSIGGSMTVAASDKLAVDMSSADSEDITIEGDIVLSVGDILRLKEGTDDEWMEVTGTGSAPTYSVDRDKNGDYSTDNNPSWSEGAVVVSYGQTSDSIIYMSSDDGASPQMSMIRNSGSPWASADTRARMGNMNGYLGISSDDFGFGAGASGEYVRYTTSTGLKILGAGIDTANSGARVRILPDPDTGILVEDDTGANVFEALVGGTDVGDVTIGDFDNNAGAQWDKSTGEFTVRGKIEATKGLSFGGDGSDGDLTVIDGASIELEASNSEYMSVSDTSSSALDLSGDFTIALKFKFESKHGPGLIYKDGAYEMWIEETSQDHNIFLKVTNSNGDVSRWFHSKSSIDGASSFFQNGQWYYVAFAIDPSTNTVKVQVNDDQIDALENGSNGIYNVTNNNSDLEIGNNFSANVFTDPDSNFDGRLDYVRLWDTFRTFSERLDNRNSSLNGDETDLVGLWQFTEELSDSTSNGNDLTFVNGTPTYDLSDYTVSTGNSPYVLDTDQVYNFNNLHVKTSAELRFDFGSNGAGIINVLGDATIDGTVDSRGVVDANSSSTVSRFYGVFELNSGDPANWTLSNLNLEKGGAGGSTSYSTGGDGGNATGANLTHSIEFVPTNNEFVSISDANQNNLDITGDISIETQIKINNAPSTGDEYDIVGKGSAYILSYVNDSGTKKLRLSLYNGSNWETYDIAQDLGTNTWTHVAVTWDSSTSTTEFFVDNSSLGTVNGTFTSINNSSSDFFISSSGKTLDGKLSEVRVWDDKRSTSEIGTYYDRVSTDRRGLSVADNLRLYVNFDQSATDNSTSDNDLSLQNSPSYVQDRPNLTASVGGIPGRDGGHGDGVTIAGAGGGGGTSGDGFEGGSGSSASGKNGGDGGDGADANSGGGTTYGSGGSGAGGGAGLDTGDGGAGGQGGAVNGGLLGGGGGGGGNSGKNGGNGGNGGDAGISNNDGTGEQAPDGGRGGNGVDSGGDGGDGSDTSNDGGAGHGGDGGHSIFGTGGLGGDGGDEISGDGGRGGDGYNGGDGGFGGQDVDNSGDGGRGGDASCGPAPIFLYAKGDLSITGTVFAGNGQAGDGGDGGDGALDFSDGRGGDGGDGGDGADVKMLTEGTLTNTGSINNQGGTGGAGGTRGTGDSQDQPDRDGDPGEDGEDGVTTIAKVIR